MGRAPCCEKVGLKKGRWTTEEDQLLAKYIQANGEGHWRSLPKNAGLLRCGKSCRLRWINYLRADIKRGNISSEEENTILNLHASFGNRWSLIASHLEGRTDNEIKNYWNSHLSRKIYSLKGTPVPPKRKGGRTSRWAMKKNKSYTTQNVHTPKQTPSSLNSEALSNAVTGEAVGDDILGLCQLESINEGGGELDMLDTCGVWDLSEENDVVVNNADACLNKTSSTSTHSIASVNGECGEWNSSCSSNAITVGLDPHWDWESLVEFNDADQHNAPPSWEHQQKLLAWLWEDDDDFQSDGVETYLHTQNDIDDWILS